jgi:hypothetical protein
MCWPTTATRSPPNAAVPGGNTLKMLPIVLLGNLLSVVRPIVVPILFGQRAHLWESPAESVAIPFLRVILPIVDLPWGYALGNCQAGAWKLALAPGARLRSLRTDNGTGVRVSTLVSSSFIPLPFRRTKAARSQVCACLRCLNSAPGQSGFIMRDRSRVSADASCRDAASIHSSCFVRHANAPLDSS